MLAVKRREGIIALLNDEKSASVSLLSEKFNVTEETIRRDLTVLEKSGRLTRTHGGAFIEVGVRNTVDVNIREMSHVKGKKKIAKACRTLIKDGDTIFLDPSTTALFVAKAISDLRLTVVTNSLLVAQELSDKDNIRLIMTGGNIIREYMCFTGQYANMILKELFFDKAFISSRSICLSAGVTDSYEGISELRKTVLSHSNESYFIGDNTKFGKVSFMKVCEISDFNAVITDKKLSDAWRDYMYENNIEYIYCE